jgi:hypothetical protein
VEHPDSIGEALMIRKIVQCVVIAFVITMLTASGKLGLFKKEGDRLTEKAKVSFIDFELKEKELGETLDGKELVVYYGQLRWNEYSGGAAGEPAVVPIQIFKPVDERKQLIPMAQYFPQSDGKFYFAMEKVEADYVLAAFPQRADPLSLPPRVKEFFDREKRNGNNWQGKRDKIH